MRRGVSGVLRVAVAAVGVLLTLGLGMVRPAVAQGPTPVAPGPEECEVEPRAIDEFLAFAGTPAATPATDAGDEDETEAFVLPDGEPADGDVRAEIAGTMRETFACINGGDFLAAFALFSDGFLRRLIAEEGGFTAEDVESLAATPEPQSEEDWIAVLAVREARVLPDGRVGALIDIGSPDAPADAEVDFITFVKEDGRYLIDEIVEGLEDQIPPAAGTPTP